MNIISSLHPWDESHLVMVYDRFNVLLDAVCQYFVEDFNGYVHQQYWPEVFFLCYAFMSLCYVLSCYLYFVMSLYYRIRMMLAS